MIIKTKFYSTDPEGFFVAPAKNEFRQYAEDTDEVAFALLSDLYEVTLNGELCEVRDCRVSAHPFNRPWPGKQRAFSQTEAAAYVSFAADEPVTVKVKTKKSYYKAIVRPLSKSIEPKISKGEIEFLLSEPGAYVLELDDSHNALHIFFDEIKEYSDAKSATYYFGEGMHFPGNINLRDNDTVYIDRNAVVFGSLCSTGAKNVRVYGGGVIDGCFEERITENCYENHTKGNVRLYNCEDLRIEDIILKNSASWCLALFNCKNVVIDSVKIVGQWRYNTDGIDLVNSSNVEIKNCFVRSFDDTISIKGIYDYEGAIENITVDNCVLWCGWGNTCEIGIETAAKKYENITFKNSDVIHTSGPAMSVLGGNQADISKVLYENINIEFSSDLEAEIVQKSEAQTYDPGEKKANHRLLQVDNAQYGIRHKNPNFVDRGKSDKLGPVIPRIRVACKGSAENISDITVSSLYLNGQKQSDLSNFETVYENFDGIKIK